MATKQTIISGTADDPRTDGIAEYSSLMGNGNIIWNTIEVTQESVIPTAGKLTNFKVGIKTAPGAVRSWTFTVRKTNAATNLSVTISNTSLLSSLDTDEVVVAAGDKVCIKAVGTGTPAACAAVYWCVDFIPDTDGETILLSNSADISLSALNVNYYHTLVGGKRADATEFDAQTLFPTAGTIKKFFVELTNAPGADNSRIFTIRKNGEAQSLAVTISGTAKTGNDVTNTVTVAAGDKLTIINTITGAPIDAFAKFGVVFLPTTQGEWIASATTDDLTNSIAVEYQHLNCGDSTLTTDETEQHGLAPLTTAKKIYVNLSTAPGAGNSWIFTLREALGSTGLTVTISNTNTSGNAAVDEAVAADALVDTLIDARAGTATSATQIAYLFYNAPEVGGWTHIAKVKGVASAAIAKVSGVAVASIAKISGVAV